jgi:hypothetical protein
VTMAGPPSRELKQEDEANTEYPFFYLQKPATGTTGPAVAYFQGPSEYFTAAASLDHYRTAHELLLAYRALYPQVRAWRHRLPRPL